MVLLNVGTKKEVLNLEGHAEELMRIQAIKLSDLFALKEGRRPRLLIASLETKLENRLHSMAGLFADLGCNVDIAPDNSNLERIEGQCLENDTDILLLMVDTSLQNEEFHDFQSNLYSQIPYIIPAVYSIDSKSNRDMLKSHLTWSFYDQQDLPITIVATILKRLVSNR